MIKLTIDEKYRDCGDENMLYVDYKNIVNLLDLGDIVFVDDGLISLKVTEKGPTHLMTGEGKGGEMGGGGKWEGGGREKGNGEKLAFSPPLFCNCQLHVGSFILLNL